MLIQRGSCCLVAACAVRTGLGVAEGDVDVGVLTEYY